MGKIRQREKKNSLVRDDKEVKKSMIDVGNYLSFSGPCVM